VFFYRQAGKPGTFIDMITFHELLLSITIRGLNAKRARAQFACVLCSHVLRSNFVML
jgi:hypothetical protein